ncbi:SEC-C metal-binding domain-containing protein [Persicobacter psychrovividus]|uniref:Uncharacterized protein n=1 Tax=Persicobacter psychrovividus TaxID=387638 RepID=A0ABM7VEW5_9BACT|nr:hypothetical protein PEPS_17420 [Persicobacter psychrovividus]
MDDIQIRVIGLIIFAIVLFGIFIWYTQSKSKKIGEPSPKHDKVHRNDSCPCGSGKKYKHCCGK